MMKLSGNERGVAMVVTLLAILILSTLGASIIFLTQSELWANYNYKILTQARYAAEAGLERTVFWMRNSYTQPSVYTSYTMTQAPVTSGGNPVVLSAMSGVGSNYPDTTVQTAFNSALSAQPVPGMGVPTTYSVAATLQSMNVVMQVGNIPFPLQVWSVTSRGDVDSAQDAQIEIESLVENVSRPAFGYAAFGNAQVCGSVAVSGNSTTDSYDSVIGPYAVSQSNTYGNVGSNGNVTVSGGMTVVNGTSSSPRGGSGGCSAFSMPGLTLNGGAMVTGGQTVLPAPLNFPPPPPTNPMTPTTNQGISGSTGLCMNFVTGCTETSMNNVRLDPGLYGNISVSSGNLLHLTAGTYNINSLDLTGGAQLVIDSGPVVLNFAGQGITGGTAVMNMAGGTTVVNPSAMANNLQVLYAGGQPINLQGGANTYAVVYAPSSNVSLAGGSDWYGSIIGRTVSIGGGVGLHYDRALGTAFYIKGEYRAVSFNWKKY